MRVSRKIAVACAVLLALVGCDDAQYQQFHQELSGVDPLLPTRDEAVQVFNDLCLNTLPSFSRFQSVGSAKGWKSGQLSKDSSSHAVADFQVADKKLFGVLANVEDEKTCMVVFDATTATAPPQQVIGATSLDEKMAEPFLRAAIQKTGNPPREKFNTPYYVFVYQLQNGSLLAYQTKDKGPFQVRVFVSLTQPIPRERVKDYISK